VTDATARCRPGNIEPCPEISIADKVRFLGDPANYPERPERVDIVETHYSWVFLTDRHAYKLKKPVRGRGFDFSTVAARRRNAMAERALNRRLARDVYLDVVALSRGLGGVLAIGGSGGAVDWLVKMVRLPAERMLDRHIASGALRRGDIEPIARHLAGFFATARRARVSSPQFLRRLRSELAETRSAFSAVPEARLRSIVVPVAGRLEAFIGRRAALFRQRLRDRRLVDGHGDLRPEHVYVNGTPRIIDCLEFRADLRQLDPVNELAYVALECRRAGGPEILRQLLLRYRARTGDKPPRELVHFYIALNATIRARIAIQHLSEPGARPRGEWIGRASGYLAIAAGECRFLSR
jgi:aminoglycoside phosphotransferase family enzyme